MALVSCGERALPQCIGRPSSAAGRAPSLPRRSPDTNARWDLRNERDCLSRRRRRRWAAGRRPARARCGPGHRRDIDEPSTAWRAFRCSWRGAQARCVGPPQLWRWLRRYPGGWAATLFSEDRALVGAVPAPMDGDRAMAGRLGTSAVALARRHPVG